MTLMRLSELCGVIDEAGFPSHLEGEDRTVQAVNTLDEASSGEVSFLSNPKYESCLQQTNAAAVILKEGISLPESISAVRCANPYAAVTVAIVTLHGYREHPRWGLSEQAAVDPSAKIGVNPNVAGGVTIAANVTVGDNCTIYPGCYLGENVRIGDDCILFPNVVIYDHGVLGDRVTIHAGSVIGVDGLGYAPHDGHWAKIPQIGEAVIGDDVEIGANCAIDRATLGQTQIGSGTKFSDLIVIGHGTKVGPDCMFVAQVGVAGSATIGRHVTLAGQVGVGGHLTIGDNVRVAGQSGVSGDVAERAEIMGSPAIPLENAKRSIYVFQKLPDWIKRIKELESQVEQLRQKLDAKREE